MRFLFLKNICKYLCEMLTVFITNKSILRLYKTDENNVLSGYFLSDFFHSDFMHLCLLVNVSHPLQILLGRSCASQAE